MDLSKLTDEQLALAEKLLPMAKIQKVPLTEKMLSVAEAIAQESKKQGINPDFVFPLVMQESGFDQSAISKKGATGVMQLMPKTAVGLNVDPTDQEQNIRGGVTLIKQLLSHENIQGDPYKILMGYNAGPNSKFFQTGNIEDLPDETLNHADKIRQLSGGVLPTVSSEVVPSTTVALPTVPVAATTTTKTSATLPPSLNPLIGAAVGAPIGASAGAAAASYKAHVDAAQAAYDYAQAQRAAKAAATGAQTVAPVAEAAVAPSVIESSSLIPSEAQHTRSFEGTQKGQGVTGRASQTTYQLRTQQIAEQAKEKARVIADLQRRGVLPKSTPSFSGNVASTPAGIIAPTEAVETMGALGKAAQTAEHVPPATSSFWKYLRGLGALPVKAALGGAGVGFGVIDALNRHNAKDDVGAAISGLGTAAGLAAPYFASAGALPSASIAAPLYLMASDRIEHLKKHPEEIRLQEDNFDPLGMPIR